MFAKQAAIKIRNLSISRSFIEAFNMKKETRTNSIFSRYLKEIASYKLLTAEEEAALAKRIAAGDKTAHTTLVNANLRLVINLVKRFSSSDIPFMDLVQEGNIGLIVAASKFNATYHTRFSTYAYHWIMQHLLRYMHTTAAHIYIPQNKYELLKKIKETRFHLLQQNGFVPSNKEIAKTLEISEKAVNEIDLLPNSISSFDTPCNENDEFALADSIPDTSIGPEERAINAIIKQEMEKMIDTLPKQERDVIHCRYDFANMAHRTLTETSQLLKVSTETVRQIEKKAISRIKTMSRTFDENETTLTA